MWVVRNISFGSFPVENGLIQNHPIPVGGGFDQIPVEPPPGDNHHLTIAKEILVYAWIAHGHGPFIEYDEDYKIFVTPVPEQEAAFYLHIHSYDNMSWAYNSDNMWLPMPSDRQLKIQAPSNLIITAGGRINSGLKIIAYRDSR